MIYTWVMCFIVPTRPSATFACCWGGGALLSHILAGLDLVACPPASSDILAPRPTILDDNVACIQTLESTDVKVAPDGCFEVGIRLVVREDGHFRKIEVRILNLAVPQGQKRTARDAGLHARIVHFHFQTCFTSQQRALFRHLNFQKWSENGVLCTF